MFNCTFGFLTLIFCVLFLQFAVLAQKTAKIETTWEDKLYEKNVVYENFSCQDEDKKTVADFFKDRPLNFRIRICHNNCAVLESFSNRKLPPFSDKVKGDGFIAIHVLANEDGKPIFARAVNGNSIMRKLAEKRACESKFKKNPEKRQQLIYYCPTDKCSEPQPVQQ